MTVEVSGGPPGPHGLLAYEREAVERFFAAARDERGCLLTEIARARRRITQAKVALASTADTERGSVLAVLDAQRALRAERRANAMAVAALRADAEVPAERVRTEAGATRAHGLSGQQPAVAARPLRRWEPLGPEASALS